MTPEQNKRFKYWQTRTILATMIGYALFYFVRKNFSLAMPGLEADLGISKTSLGIFLTLNGVIYGFSRFFNGILADRMNARWYMSIGLALCALSNLAFGFGEDISYWITGEHDGSQFTNTMVLFMGVMWVVNGLLQGTGFPPCARLLTHWIPPTELATKMSWWNTSHSIGAGLVVILCGYVMGTMGMNMTSDSEAVERTLRNLHVWSAEAPAQPVAVAAGRLFSADELARAALPMAEPAAEAAVEPAAETPVVSAAAEGVAEPAVESAADPAAEAIGMERIVAAIQRGPEAVRALTEEMADREEAGKIRQAASSVAHVGAWRWCFWIPAAISLLGALALVVLLRDTPSSVGLPELAGTETREDKTAARGAEHRAFLRKHVFGNPLIWILGFANFFVYVVRFSVLDWGPSLLSQSKGVSMEHAGWLVAMFEIAGIIGMVFSGWATDRWLKGRAHRTCVFCMAGAALFVFLFWQLPADAPVWLLFATLCAAGFCIYGPQALIDIAAANQATKKAAATANGLTGLFGYASTVVSGVGLGYVAQHYGWNWAYVGIILLAVVGMAVFLLMWGARADGYDSETA